ncbi:twin-arginine translocase subunit TatC [Proteinivorax hydrogeniformans]|uniref:Sec-independent protein translocase protein TatC n=1 Tax=Proteinivorax hydrogeniformans TaxID=1826727 RepID=A0AAU8HRE7_9FIRM
MEGKSLTIVGHLAELRARIIVTAISILLGTMASYIFIDEIVNLITMPAGHLDFVYLSPPELFLAYIKISIIFGMIVASPIILYQIWAFVMPSINKKEKVYVFFAIILSSVFFIGGVIFSYLSIIPLTIDFFVEMSGEDILPMFSFSNYTSFITSILLAFGVAFQLPLLVLLLTQLRLIKPKLLKKSRKFIILAIFLMSSILTPPDVISQMLLAGPMIILFEMSIVISSVIDWRRSKNS